jgi:GrpB-like predicted nucleotidyltransferase (UPF0157 family)
VPDAEDQREAVVVVDYDAAWPLRFEEERARIVAALGDVTEGRVAVEHVGSTAVPGLAAKPVIDIVVGVRDLDVGERCVGPLEAIGYEYRGEAGIPGRLYFRKGNPRTHHVHMVRHGSELWERHVLFRDLLRERPAIAAEYGALKRELAVRYRTRRLEYTDAKTPFIEEALAEARADR